MLTLLEDKITTPLGELWIICDEEFQLRAVEWEIYTPQMNKYLDHHYLTSGYRRLSHSNPGYLSSKILDYFSGNLAIIESLPVASAGTPFQKQVWAMLRTIPCGQAVNYGQIAAAIGKPGASRAVGAANGANPVSIVVPCHRVIGSNGTLTGYSGGLERKEWLLRHEGYLLL
ncbi:methylated-DNA--protein-cysteine methyltransferase [Salmonella enterica subsp. enterica serovar Choleraesuis]|nr:methylated-DNA--protein-cysteine methyltransferase [Salmonella enterica subsp. enterica serovar Choleraesuis]